MPNDDRVQRDEQISHDDQKGEADLCGCDVKSKPDFSSACYG